MHGNLVNEDAARGIAQSLTPEYQAAGAFPIFFVWESGLIESADCLRGAWAVRRAHAMRPCTASTA
jgi:hypothetical protein